MLRRVLRLVLSLVLCTLAALLLLLAPFSPAALIGTACLVCPLVMAYPAYIAAMKGHFAAADQATARRPPEPSPRPVAGGSGAPPASLGRWLLCAA